jgi:hypothetical protein
MESLFNNKKGENMTIDQLKKTICLHAICL